MWNSNFNFEELLSIFFVSTTFTSLKALLVNVFVCRSNHSGLVGMSVIFETMIPPSLTPLQSSLSPFFSTFNLCFSSLAGDSKLSAFETIPFSPILLCPCLPWSRSSFDFIIGSISCPLFCPISESVFSFKPLPDRPFLFFFFLSLRSFDLDLRSFDLDLDLDLDKDFSWFLLSDLERRLRFFFFSFLEREKALSLPPFCPGAACPFCSFFAPQISQAFLV